MGYIGKTKMLALFKDGTLDGRSFTGICRYFAKEGVSRFMVGEIIDGLLSDGKLVKIGSGFYLSDAEIDTKRTKNELLSGTFRANEKGFGFVTVAGDGDYFIRSENMGQALNGDEVTIRRIGGGRGDLAEIVRVDKRAAHTIVGTLFTEGRLRYVRPDDRAFFADIYVQDPKGVPDGQKVLVEIKRFPKNRCPEGVITEVIGVQYEFATEERSLILAAGVQTEFDPETLENARAEDRAVDENDIIGRRDLRGELIFTIDGENARDFDDAVSLKEEDDGYRLGVHIADVSHYVKEDTALDKTAFLRGTSIYLPDGVIPMLPFELSNGICSLNEGVDRLTMTVDIKFDRSGNVVDSEIYESVLRSKHRLTYDLVQRMLDGDEEVKNAYPDVVPVIEKMNKLRLILEEKRRVDGYIDLDVKESEITLSGEQIDVGVHKSCPSTRIIEHFMIAANEVVAGYLYYGSVPCVYRVHEKPTPEKIEQLKLFMQMLGVKVNWRRDECYPSDIRRLLTENSDSPFFAIINRTVLRSLQKAKYSSENSGHFGLASKCYCHFTSPIRRYPDLAVHRILKKTLKGEILPFIDLFEDFAAKVGENCSLTERKADELERNVDDLYKTQYMSDKIGEEFDGIISSVLSGGFFVELDNTCEGFVPIELLPAGSYEYDKEKCRLSSRRRSYKLGDRVRVCVLSADIATRRVDLCLAKRS